MSTVTSVYCRACYMRRHMAQDKRPKCFDCKRDISWSNGHMKGAPKRCVDCEALRRQREAVVVARSDRRVLQSDSRKVRHARHWANPFRKELGPRPCAVCGYDKTPSAIHRLVAENGYVYGNVVQVCRNCHEEVHRGIIPCPPATLDVFVRRVP